MVMLKVEVHLLHVPRQVQLVESAPGVLTLEDGLRLVSGLGSGFALALGLGFVLGVVLGVGAGVGVGVRLLHVPNQVQLVERAPRPPHREEGSRLV